MIGEVEGDETCTYVRGVNLIFGRARYYLYNAHGDVVQLTNTNGELTKNYNYDAFGNERSPDEEDANPFRYCGEYFDTETGLYYLRARYYDPLIGRFTQSDSVRYVYRDLPNGTSAIDPLSLNLYTYCTNNPVMYGDPTGHAWETILDIVGFIWSAVDFKNDPSWNNAAFLVWDFVAILVPIAPGSYAAKGVRAIGKVDDIVDLTRGIKVVTRLDDGVDLVRFVKGGNILYGSYRDMQKYTKGYKGALQAHHLLEQRFRFSLGFNVDDMISVVLTKDQHQFFTNLWREYIPLGTDYETLYHTWDDIRDIAEKVYADYPELFELLDNYMRSLE